MNAETIIRNMDKLRADRSLLNSRLEEVSNYAVPEKCGNFFDSALINQDGEDKPRDVIIDIVSEANSTFANGMFSNLCPPGVKSFHYSPVGENAKDNKTIRDWFSAASQTVFELMGKSNFTTEISEAFEDFGWAGTVNTAIEEDPQRVFRFMTYHISEYYIREDANKIIDQVYREFKQSALQIVGKYNLPDDDIPEKIASDAKSSEYSSNGKQYTLIHVVYPNPDFRKLNDDGEPMVGNKHKAWRSVTVCRETKSIIRDSGMDHMPYCVARLQKRSKSAYGFSPGLRVRRSAGILNQAINAILMGGQRAIDPPPMLDVSAYKGGLKPTFYNYPGAVNLYDSAGGAKPPSFAPVPTNFPVGLELVQMFEKDVHGAYMVNLFQMLQQLSENTNRDKTAYEVMQLVSEKYTMIIPVVARIIEEYFQSLHIKAFYMAYNAGKLGVAPKGLLDENGNFDVDVTFDSPLALAAQRSQLKSVFDASAAVLQIDQQGLDWLNLDKFTQFVFESYGVSGDFMRSETEVQQIREARQKAMQEQLAQQQMADVAKAQDLNKAPEGGSIASMVGGTL